MEETEAQRAQCLTHQGHASGARCPVHVPGTLPWMPAYSGPESEASSSRRPLRCHSGLVSNTQGRCSWAAAPHLQAAPEPHPETASQRKGLPSGADRTGSIMVSGGSPWALFPSSVTSVPKNHTVTLWTWHVSVGFKQDMPVRAHAEFPRIWFFVF